MKTLSLLVNVTCFLGVGSLLLCSHNKYSENIYTASSEHKTLFRGLTSINNTSLSSGDVEKVLEYGDSVLNEGIPYFENFEITDTENDSLVLFGDTTWNRITSILEINENPFVFFQGSDTLYTKIINTLKQGSYTIVHLKGVRREGIYPYASSFGYNAFVIYKRSWGKLIYIGSTPFLSMCYRNDSDAVTQIIEQDNQIFLIAYCNIHGNYFWRQNLHVYKLLPKPKLVHYKMMKAFHQSIYWSSEIESIPPPNWMSKLVDVDFIKTPYDEMYSDFWSNNSFNIGDDGNSLIVEREIRHYSSGWNANTREMVEDSLKNIRIINEYDFNLVE